MGSSARHNLDEIKETKSAERKRYKYVATNSSEVKNANLLHPNNALSEYYETKTNSTRMSGSYMRPVTGNKYRAPGTLKDNTAMK